MRFLALVVLAAGLIASADCAQAQDSAKTRQNVIVAPVVSRNVTPSQDYVGRVEARSTVQLQARVDGFLE